MKLYAGTTEASWQNSLTNAVVVVELRQWSDGSIGAHAPPSGV